LIADHFRRAPRESAPLLESMMANASPAAEAEARVRQGRVRAAIRRLTPKQQEVLALRFGDGFSVEQTAEATHKSVPAVKSLQLRALDSLRRWLAEVESD
jgi:RNA polymerase sigma-70 factor (ECF subfamily)